MLMSLYETASQNEFRKHLSWIEGSKRLIFSLDQNLFQRKGKWYGSNEDVLSIFKNFSDFSSAPKWNPVLVWHRAECVHSAPRQHRCCWEQRDKRFAVENDHSPQMFSSSWRMRASAKCSVVLKLELLFPFPVRQESQGTLIWHVFTLWQQR